MIVWLGAVALIILSAFAQVHLRRTTDDEEYGLTDGQRRARSSPDGGGFAAAPVVWKAVVWPARLHAAEVKRERRRARNLQIAGRRRGRRLVPFRPPPSARWWRRTARH